MKQSTIDKYGRHILFFWGIVFALVAYILWKNVIVEHQWPNNLDLWIGLISTPLVSLVSLGTAIFYHQIKKKSQSKNKPKADNK